MRCLNISLCYSARAAFLVGDGAVARDDGLYVQREDEVASANPVSGGAGPHDRVAAAEEDIVGLEVGVHGVAQVVQAPSV